MTKMTITRRLLLLGSSALALIAVLAWCVPLTVVAVLLVGWAEDVAARRSPTLWPRVRSAH